MADCAQFLNSTMWFPVLQPQNGYGFPTGGQRFANAAGRALLEGHACPTRGREITITRWHILRTSGPSMWIQWVICSPGQIENSDLNKE